MDIGKSLTFQFEDKLWFNKLGIAALVSIVPILNFALSGYVVQILRNVERQAPEPLPGWDDLGQKFMDGLILVAAGLVYALPALILFCLPTALLIASGAVSGNENLQNLANSLATAGGVLFYCLLCLIALYALLLSVIHPAMAVIFSRQGTFASCFKLREILELIRQHASEFFTGWIGYIVATLIVSLVVGFLGVAVGWIPCIGQAVGVVVGVGSLVYITTVYAHIFGQFARAASG